MKVLSSTTQGAIEFMRVQKHKWMETIIIIWSTLRILHWRTTGRSHWIKESKEIFTLNWVILWLGLNQMSRIIALIARVPPQPCYRNYCLHTWNHLIWLLSSLYHLGILCLFHLLIAIIVAFLSLYLSSTRN